MQPTTQTPIRALVLAAGKGKRLQSEAFDLPKVLRAVEGRPMLHYVLSALDFLPPENVLLVVGYQAEKVLGAVDPAHPHALQEEQLGTGHAVACAKDWILSGEGPVLVCCGDMPLMRKETFQSLLQAHADQGNLCTLLSCRTEEDLAYGRILRQADGSLEAIVEAKDCTEAQRAIREYNAGVYVFEPKALVEALAGLRNENAQGEYYLTDVPGNLKAAGHRVGVIEAAGMEECMGVNTLEDLEEVSRWVRQEGKT